MKIVACDPGESFGYCVGEDTRLDAAGTVEMWDFVHALAEAVDLSLGSNDPALVARLRGADHVVIEDWQLYPWVIQAGGLDFDKCRTARAIGALEFICRASGTPYTLQPAKIKETAQAAGVDDLYLAPVHENRHANDAMQHFVYFNLKQGRTGVAWAEEGAAAL